MAALRLMLYDRTAGALALSWKAGGALYGALGRLDAWFGAASWEEGLDWLAAHRAAEPVAEVQYWGHGHPGRLFLDRVVLDRGALAPASPLHGRLARIRDRLAGPEALWWFRTCLTFGGPEGHAFARDWTAFMGCRAAGHTYVIGPLQPGLHSLRPGEAPTWPEAEGGGGWLGVGRPNTITCLTGRLPPGA